MSESRPQTDPPESLSGTFTSGSFSGFNVPLRPDPSESPEERQHRLVQQRYDADLYRKLHERQENLKRRIAAASVIFALGLGTVAGWYAFLADGVTESAQANASAIVTTIVGGLLGAGAGYVLGSK